MRAIPKIQLLTIFPKHLPQSAGMRHYIINVDVTFSTEAIPVGHKNDCLLLPDYYQSSSSWTAQFVTIRDILFRPFTFPFLCFPLENTSPGSGTLAQLQALQSGVCCIVIILVILYKRIREGLIGRVTFERRPEVGRENSRLRKRVKSPQGRNSFAFLGTARGPYVAGVEWAIRVGAGEVWEVFLR